MECKITIYISYIQKKILTLRPLVGKLIENYAIIYRPNPKDPYRTGVKCIDNSILINNNFNLK